MQTLITEFVAHLAVARGRAQATRFRYAQIVNRLVGFAERALKRSSVQPADIDGGLVDRFVHFGERSDSEPSAASTRKVRRAAIRSFYQWLIRTKRATSDPTAGVLVPRVRSCSPSYLEPGEFIRLCTKALEVASDTYVWRDLAILVLLFHGLRLGELVSLDLGQVGLESRRCYGVLRKGQKHEDVLLTTFGTEVLRRWLQARKQFAGADTCSACFLSDRGRRISPRSVERMFARCVRAAGFTRHLTPHSLRHSFATALAGENVSIDVLASLMSHADTATTGIYTHANDPRRRAAMDRLDVLLAPLSRVFSTRHPNCGSSPLTGAPRSGNLSGNSAGNFGCPTDTQFLS